MRLNKMLVGGMKRHSGCQTSRSDSLDVFDRLQRLAVAVHRAILDDMRRQNSREKMLTDGRK